MDNKYLILSASWICWCLFHSLLASAPVTVYLQKCMGRLFCFYRLLYNLFAAITLIVPLAYTAHFQLAEPPVFVWDGLFAYFRWTMILLAVILFFGGATRYDLSYFSGLFQIRTAGRKRYGNVFKTTGILGFVRHPWYAGGILLVWSALQVISLSSLITAVILTLYFLLGIVLEEKKLIEEYGDSYRNYQEKVSMLFPGKWLLRKIQK